jgi:hypothetical protein
MRAEELVALRSEHETTLDPDRLVHVGIWRDELDEISRRFYRWDVPALPRHVAVAIDAGIREDAGGIGLDDMPRLVAPGALALEDGAVRLPDGGISVAVRTEWPGTTPEMIDWWFGWHIARTERYKLWHPQAHVFTQPRYDLSGVGGLTDRERYVGNTSWVDEYIGPFLSRLAITFHDPADLGLTDAVLAAGGFGTAVCARTYDSDHGHLLAHLVHAVRRDGAGSEMRSRFVFGPGTPDFVAGPMIDHCWTEMTHLAGFLPELFAVVHAQGGTQGSASG